MTPLLDEMVDGYRDGRDLSTPEPSANRTHCYRHGFANGRHEALHKCPRASAETLRELADEAMRKDTAL